MLAQPPQPPSRLAPYLLLGLIWPLALVGLWPFIWWVTHLSAQHGAVTAPWRISDFAMFFASGHAALSPEPGRVYIKHLLLAWEYRHVAGFHHVDPFVYPPPTLLLTAAVGAVGYWHAYLLWSAVLTLLSAIILRLARLPWWIIALTILSPAGLFSIMLGQLGLLSGCCFIASLLLIDTAPAVAGFLSALTIFKPQAALPAPIAIFARRRWSGVIAGLITVAALVLLSFIAFGPEIWRAYLRHGLASSGSLLTLPYPQPAFGPHYRGGFEYDEVSVFYMLRSLGLSLDAAILGQVLCAIGAIMACCFIWRREQGDYRLRIAITIFLGLLVTPYGFTQDMVGFSGAILLVIWQRGYLTISDVLLMIWPALIGASSAVLGVSLTPLVVLWAARRANAALRQDRIFTPDVSVAP